MYIKGAGAAVGAPKHRSAEAGEGGPALRFCARREVLLDVACWRTTEHRFVRIEGVLDLAIEIEIVLGRLRRHRRRRWFPPTRLRFGVTGCPPGSARGDTIRSPCPLG